VQFEDYPTFTHPERTESTPKAAAGGFWGLRPLDPQEKSQEASGEEVAGSCWGLKRNPRGPQEKSPEASREFQEPLEKLLEVAGGLKRSPRGALEKSPGASGEVAGSCWWPQEKSPEAS
jgi:hypothetical protein